MTSTRRYCPHSLVLADTTKAQHIRQHVIESPIRNQTTPSKPLATALLLPNNPHTTQSHIYSPAHKCLLLACCLPLPQPRATGGARTRHSKHAVILVRTLAPEYEALPWPGTWPSHLQDSFSHQHPIPRLSPLMTRHCLARHLPSNRHPSPALLRVGTTTARICRQAGKQSGRGGACRVSMPG